MKLKEEWPAFLTAVMFFTRLPVSGLFEYREEYAARAARYFPLAGLLVGVLVSGAFTLFYFFLPFLVSLLLAIAFGLLVTGAFHEDGFADMCDGLGGGWTREQALEIMKDSRLGTYGAVALMTLMALKISALYAIGSEWVPLVLIAGHVLSRAVSTSLIYSWVYAQDDDRKKINALSMNLTAGDLLFVLLTGLLSVIWLPFSCVLVVIVSQWLLRELAGWYLQKRLGGYTGDCLGGVQQLSELLFFLVLLGYA
jgi:adenosylcobinamide-GDP ribazoletransferase